MVPSDVIFVDQIPLTINGKVNKDALLKHKTLVATGGTEALNKTLTEQQLCRIWQGLLGKPINNTQQSFFELGGHSLLVTRMVSAIQNYWHVGIKIRDVFDLQSVSRIAEFIDSAQQISVSIIAPAPEADHYPLSFAQNRLWLTDKIEGQSAQYHVPFLLHFEGIINVQCLQLAFRLLIKRHEVLRTNFRELASGKLAQIINNEEQSLDKFVFRQSRLLAGQNIRDFAVRQIQLPFDLGTDLMLRADLISETSESHYLLVTVHHIATDGWSVGILTDELCQHYQALLDEPDYDPPGARIQYKDFAVWQQQQMSHERLQSLLQYWQDALQGAPQLHSLPLDRPRLTETARQGATVSKVFSHALSQQLQEFAQQRDMTLYMVLNGLLAVVMQRYSGQTDMVIGTPVAGREHLSAAVLLIPYLYVCSFEKRAALMK